MLKKEELEKQAEGAVTWIKEYVKQIGAKGVIVGNSGGKDSATVIAMATKALGKEKVIAVSMPCHSISHDFEDAKLVADTFDVKFLKVDLTNTYNEMEKEIQFAMGEELSKEATINMTPSLLYVPKTNTSDRKSAICFCGKLTTANICFPTNSSGVYRFVICADDFLIPISSPKSISNLYAGFFAFLNSSALRMVPTLISNFIKSSKVTIYLFSLYF